MACVLLAAVLHAGWNALLKKGEDPLFDTASVMLGAALVVAPFAWFVPIPAPASWPYIAVSTVLHMLYFVAIAGAYRNGDLSLTYPLMRGLAPVIVALGAALWLQERLTWLACAGVLLVSGGVLAISRTSVRSLAHHRVAVRYALANALIIAAYTVVDAAGARVSGSPATYVVWLTLIDGILIFAGVRAFRQAQGVPASAVNWQRACIGGAASAGSYAIVLWAMTQAPVALVSAVRETSVLFATALGAWMLKEKLGRHRWLGAGCVVLGIVALRLA
jgi:drug/metabolite transporter (DMT)-like permease